MAEEFESSTGNWWDASRSISPSNSAVDPNLHNMGLGLDWNQPVLNLSTQETEQHHQQQNQWMRSEKLYSGESPAATDQFKAINRGISLDHQNQPQFSPSQYSADTSTLYGNSATLFQGLLSGEQHQQQQGSGAGMNFPYSAHFGELMTAASSSWSNSKVPQFLTNSAPQPHSHLQFSNNTAFWNAPSVIKDDVRTSSFPPSYNAADKSMNISEVGDSGTVGKKSGNDQNQQSGAAAKRPRNETPSPLPAFKVRKQKMGDRITALQQLVSPFGKTDSASVLSEAIEYIKFLHEQVNVLSSPYLKSGAAVQQQHQQQSYEKTKEVGEGGKQDLRSRGLCLVPISSTFPVTHETTVDFWTPNFAGTYT